MDGSPESLEVRRQLTRSGTSVGANVEEADGAASKAEARRSFVVARKGIREVRYRLRIVERRCPACPGVAGAIGEATGILSILSKIVERLS
jgi:four helix bundle protein